MLAGICLPHSNGVLSGTVGSSSEYTALTPLIPLSFNSFLIAAQVVCESIIKIEKLAAELNSLQNQIGADENKLKDIYDKMKLFEEKSSKKLACIMG